VARQRRFAGQLPQFGAATPEMMEAAQETIRTAGQFLKPSRGGRLGTSSATEQAEGAAARLANPQVFQPGSPGASNPLQDIAKLRKDLGIDELISSISQLRSQQGTQTQTGGIADLTFPEFEMPEFDLPDFGSMLPEEQQFGAQQEAAPQTQPSAAQPRGRNRGRGGVSSYNLSKFGGPGLGGRDVKALLSRGATKAQLKSVAKTAPNISASGAAQLQKAGVKIGGATQKASNLSSAGAKVIAKAQKANKAGQKKK
jgi:hypothetical protein